MERLKHIDNNGKYYPFRELHLKSIELANIFCVLDFIKRSEKVSGCGTYLKFAVTETEKKLVHANFCGARLCPQCQKRRSMKLIDQLVKMCCEIEKRHPTYRYLFLTLTVPNVSGDNLSDTIDHLMRSWKRLSQRKEFRKAVRGFTRTMEVTYNAEKNTYHPHFHCLLCVSRDYFKTDMYIAHEDWLRLWQESTRQSEIKMVRVEVADRKKGQRKTMVQSPHEVAKYCAKMDEYLSNALSEEQKIELVRVLNSALGERHLIHFGGLMREVRKDLGLVDGEKRLTDEVDVEDSVAFEFYCWSMRYLDYIRSKM